MFWAVFIFSLLFSGCVTVIAGNGGVVLPLLPLAAFYFSMKSTAGRTLPWSVLVAALVDAIWMRRFPGTVVSVLLVTALTAFWRKFGDLGAWASLASAALCIAAVTWLGQFVAVLVENPHVLGPRWLVGRLLSQVLWAEFLTPVFVFVLERILGKRIWVEEREAEGDEG